MKVLAIKITLNMRENYLPHFILFLSTHPDYIFKLEVSFGTTFNANL